MALVGLSSSPARWRWARAVIAFALLFTQLLGVAQPAFAAGSVSLTTDGAAYTENFNTLVSSSTGTLAANTPAGWNFSESGTGANTTYTAGTGSGTAGDTYSFGATAATDRAFGGLLSGSVVPTIGASFANDTGTTITSLDIAYVGEQWRIGNNSTARDDRMDFQYSTDATSLTTGTWTDVNGLDFTNLVKTAAAVGALDGNASANRAAISGSISNLTIANGATFWIRWTDFNATGSDDGLAVDDFSLTPHGTVVADQPITTGGATTLTTTEGTAASATVTASDPDSTITGAAITSAAVAGISLSGFSGGNSASVSLDVNGNVPAGTYSVDIRFDNTTNQTATATVAVTVNPPAGSCPTPSSTLVSIPALQGTTDTNTANGQNRTVRGVVVADVQGSPGQNGFYIQDPAGDGNPATSDGLFVFVPSANTDWFGFDVAVGDAVQVSGTASEFQGLTELTSVTSIVKCGTNQTLTPTTVHLPETTEGDLEQYEGMLVSIPETLTVQQNFFQGRYGQVTLGAGGRLYQPTNLFDAGGTQAINEANKNARSLIVLDDGNSAQNPSPIPYIGQNNTLRAGDTASNLVGALDFGPVNSDTSIRDYRLQPTQPVTIARVNNRTSAPEAVGGNVKVASFNVLNYFNGNGSGGGFPTSRGASTAAEFARQRDKIIAAITAIDPAVAGLMEMENDGSDSLSAIQDLVNGLNAATSAGTYAFVVEPAPGTDEIKVAMIYQPALVSPVGAAVNYQFTDATYGALFDRPPLAQTFQHSASGAKFTVIVNHFKSKGSCPTSGADTDQGDGQGCWNVKRTRQAQELLNFISARQAAVGDPDVLVIGDLNAYGMEDPIQALTTGGLINTIEDKIGTSAYSYVFDGMSGYLDHALATSSLNSQISGVTEWHINADEPSVIDYNTEFKPQDLYTPTPYRASDHDPVVVGLSLSGAPTQTDPSGTGSASPSTVTAGDSTTLTVVVTPGSNPTSTGITVMADLTAIGGSATQAFTSNGSGSYSFVATVNANTAAGAKSLPFTIADAEGRSASGTISLTVQAPAAGASVVISEFRTRGPVGGNDEFYELFNSSSSAVDISGWKINGSSSAGATSTRLTLGSNIVLQPGQHYLAVNRTASSGYSGTVAGDNATGLTTGIADDGGVALLSASSVIIDQVGMSSGSAYGEGTRLGSFGSANSDRSYRRNNKCVDTDDNSADFAMVTPGTPQNLASALTPCGVTTPTNPSGTGTASPSTVTAGGQTTLTVVVTPGTNPASTGTTVTADLSSIGGSATQAFTDNGNDTFSFTATVSANTVAGAKSLPFTVADAQGRTGSGAIALTVTAIDPCSANYTHIYSIQGSGTSAAITGDVTTQGVVVGDFEGTAAASGFYLQDLTGDGSTATSDGIFVFTGSADTVSIGQVVRVTGYARERFSQTALNGSNSDSAAVTSANILVCGTGSVPATDVTLPFASATDPERYEGMLVRFPEPLVIAEYFNYDRFGEIVLAKPLNGEPRPFTGTALDEPGAAANARTAANALSRITLDDAQSAQNPPVLRHPNGQPFSLNNLFRGGDTVQNAIGVLGYDFNLYRLVPTGPADYTAANPRPAAPGAVGGNLRVAAMNTLNFFVTADYPTGNALDNKCGPANNQECRGWDSDQSTEFTRQRDKLLQALTGLDADVIGLNELENSTGVEPLQSITSGMSGYAYIDTGTIGTDAIKVGLIYRSGVVTPVGPYKLLTSAVDPRFIDTKSRPSLAQTFQVNATGARFTVVVNHLKSKGSACTDVGDPDLNDGQGNCSQTRRAAAEALVDWLATDPTGSGDPDFLILGDLNSYAKEDTIGEIKAGADDTAGTSDDFTNLIAQYQGDYAYSYTFDGQAGYLDHALANASMAAQVTGAADWHINSDEPDVLDYDTSFKPAAQDALYEPNAYRTSDHDPVVVGLNLVNTPPTANSQSVTTAEDTPVNITLSGSDPEGHALTYTYTQPAHGMVTGTGPNVTYTPAANYNGSDSFTFTVNDGASDSAPATISITVTAVNDLPTVMVAAGQCAADFRGVDTLALDDVDNSAASLTLSASSSNTTLVPNGNVTFGGSGASRTVTIATANGKSGTAVVTISVSDGTTTTTTTITVIAGTSNNDTLTGTASADMLFAGGAQDTLTGNGGSDLLCGGQGDDKLYGNDGNDVLDAGQGQDQLDGGQGDDALYGGQGDDKLTGGIGNDTLYGGQGQDQLDGADGNDQMYGEQGDDKLTGGTGADLFDGGPGNDQALDYNAAEGDTKVSVP